MFVVLIVNFIKKLFTMLFALGYIGYYLHKSLKGDEDNKKLTNEQYREEEKEIASAVETREDTEAIEDTKKCMNNQSFALTYKQSQQYEKGMASAVEALEDTKKCTNKHRSTNIYVNTEVARQIYGNRFNFCNNAKSVRSFQYKYTIGSSTFDTAETQDDNYYKLKIHISKIDVGREHANNGEDVESDSATLKRINRRILDDKPGQLVGSIFLTDYSLNTIIVNGDNNYYCCVCGHLECEEDKMTSHIRSGKHLKNLKLTPPLENNICIRYIYDRYHCAVCGTLFKGPLMKHSIDNNHILCLSLAQVKARKLRQRGTVNEKTNKKKRKTKRKSRNDRRNGNLPRSISDWDSNEDYDSLVESIRREVASQENKNLPSPESVKSAYEENCDLLKSTFPDYYNLSELSHEENCNLPNFVNPEIYNFPKYKEAFEENCNLRNYTTPEIHYFPKYKETYEENCNLLKSAFTDYYNLSKSSYEENCNLPNFVNQENCNLPNFVNPEIYNFPKYKEAFEENCNLRNYTTPEIHHFPKYKETYEENCNLPNSATSEIYNFFKYKETYEENCNLANSATLEIYNFLKYKEAYEKKCNVINSATPDIYNFRKYKEAYEENCYLLNSATPELYNSPKYKEAYEENCNLLKSAYLKNSNLPKYKETFEENSNLLNSATLEMCNFPKYKALSKENCNLPKYKEAYEENSNLLNSATPEICNFPKYERAYEQNCNLLKSAYLKNCNLPKYKEAYEENSNLLNSATPEIGNFPKYERAYEQNCNLLKSAYLKNSNLPKYKEVYEENSNLLNSATPENCNFPKYERAYEQNCNLLKSAYLKNSNLPKYKEAYEENSNLLNSATPEICNFPKYERAYEQNCNLLKSAYLKNSNLPKYKEAYEENSNLLNSAIPENCNLPKYKESYEETCNIIKSVSPEIYDIPKYKEASEANSNLDKTSSSENFNLPEYKEAYEENCNILKSVTPENFNVIKSSHKEKHNIPESICREYRHLPKADFEEKYNSAEIVHGVEKNESIDKKEDKNKLKIDIVNDELENYTELMYEAKVVNHNSGIVVEFLGSALRVDINSYNFIKKVTELDMLCMICGCSLDSHEFNSHIEKVAHIVSVKNAQYNPIYGCHLLRPLPYKNYHCSLCNDEFNRKTLKMHILSDTHKMQLLRSLIRNWNGGDYDEYCLMMPKKEPQVLPILESVEKLNVAELKSIDSSQEEREIVSSNTVEFSQPMSGLEGAGTDEIVSEDLNDLSSQELANVKIAEANIRSGDFVHVKLGGVYLAVGLNNYHSLFLVGDGRRRCFVCSVNVDKNVEDHVTDERHLDNVASVKFVELYSTKVFRKNFMYHCIICNFVMLRHNVEAHIETTHHKLMMRASQMVSENRRDVDLKNGISLYTCEYRKDDESDSSFLDLISWHVE